MARGDASQSATGGRRQPSDWVDAAYARFEDEGLDGVRVEAVARDLGVTKGSFYWHFTDRAALVDAVMDRWEATETDRFIAVAEVADDPVERLRLLFAAVARRTPGGEQRLYADAQAAGVADSVTRVTERRRDYIADLLEQLGFPRDEAERRGLAAIAIALGTEQLALGGAGALFGGRGAMADAIVDLVIAPPRA